jgi:hypothetical protein
MLFRRRDRSAEEPDPKGAAAPGPGPPAVADEAADERPPSITGTYLTDGHSLFRVQHAITEADGLHLEEALLELEDCRTLELILCSAGALERLGLRPVSPAESGAAAPTRQHDGATEPFARSR